MPTIPEEVVNDNSKLANEINEEVKIVPDLDKMDDWLIRIERRNMEASQIQDGEIIERTLHRKEFLERNMALPLMKKIVDDHQKAAVAMTANEDAGSGDYEIIHDDADNDYMPLPMDQLKIDANDYMPMDQPKIVVTDEGQVVESENEIFTITSTEISSDDEGNSTSSSNGHGMVVAQDLEQQNTEAHELELSSNIIGYL